MAGHGPPPKEPEQRAGRGTPIRGEWQTLGPLAKPVLPALPARGKGNGSWSTRTRRAWEGWRADWATGVFTKAEIAQTIELAFLYEDAVRGRPLWHEVRQWTDRLGLNPKGKADLRLRLGEPVAEKPQREASVTRLRLVNDAVVAK